MILVFSGNWASTRISSEIARIILEEAMNYGVDLIDTASGYSAVFANGIVGCLDPDVEKDVQCKTYDTSRPKYHITTEGWMGTQRRIAGFPENIRPPVARTLDFALDDTYFLSKAVLTAELNSTGCGLDHYRCYEASKHSPHVYFDTWQTMVQALGTSNLAKCSEDADLRGANANHYRAVTGDTGSMTLIPGTSSYQITCLDDVVWFSPACRNDTSRCVPLMVQYTRQQGMQLSAFHNVPLAIVAIKYETDPLKKYYEVARGGRYLFAWYTPDDSLIDFGGNMPIQLTWPRHNKLEYDQNTYSTDLASYMPINYYWANLPNVGEGADVVHLMENFDLYNEDQASLMGRSRLLKDAGMSDEFQVGRLAACEWVKAKVSRWSLWLGIWCQSGFFADETERTCKPCPAGQFCLGRSQPVTCPLGSYCPALSSTPTPCPLGTEGLKAGAKNISSCTPCQAGYTKTYLTLGCLPCPVGSFCTANSSSPELCGPGTYSDQVSLFHASLIASFSRLVSVLPLLRVSTLADGPAPVQEVP